MDKIWAQKLFSTLRGSLVSPLHIWPKYKETNKSAARINTHLSWNVELFLHSSIGTRTSISMKIFIFIAIYFRLIAARYCFGKLYHVQFSPVE
jgi:hypothetical protein